MPPMRVPSKPVSGARFAIGTAIAILWAIPFPHRFRPARIAMQQAVKKPAATLPLKDPSLLRQQCYINGKWVDADSGKTINVDQSRDGRGAGHRAQSGCGRDPARHRGGERRLARLAQEDGQGARQHPAQMVQPDDGEPGRPGHADDGGAGQAAGRGQGRDRLRRLLRRMVRRGSQARLWRHHSRSTSPTSASS